jgi:hypothetical protein
MPFRIVLAESRKDRRRTLAFVRRHVRRLYGGIPPPSQILLFAEQNGRICGTMALDFAGVEDRFHLEDVYGIDYVQTPWPFERPLIAQFSKWWTTRPGVAVHLMLAAHEHALKCGKKVGLVEVKPRIVERVGEFGMVLTEVPGATLQIHGLSGRGEGYYAEPPFPKLYMFDIAANATALRWYTESQG